MKLRWAIRFVAALVIGTVAGAAAPGEFRGQIVSPTHNDFSSVQYIYVLGRNRLIRKVDIQNAKVTYASGIPRTERTADPRTSLLVGAEVRVTAGQGAKGDWRAERVEILHSAPMKTDAKAQ